MRKFLYLIFELIFLMVFLTNITKSQPTDSTRVVIIESIYINEIKQTGNLNKILASEKDSITINFRLKAAQGAEKSPFLFQSVFKNGVDSSVKTIGVTSAIFKNLKNDNYNLKIAAFDLQRKWFAIPVALDIEVDNEKSDLMKSQDSLNSRIKTLLDLVRSPAADSTGKNSSRGFGMTVDYLMIALILLLIAAAFYLWNKGSKNKKLVSNANLNSIQTQDFANMKNMVNKSDFDIIQMENSRLRAEIASLRGQIDAMNIRSTQLSAQNRDLQTSITKLSKHKADLEELQKQKDELFAVIIHDIKNPASLIKSLVELLTSYDLSATEQQEIIADIANTTIKIVALSQEVSRILSLETNKLNLNFDVCNMNEVVKDVFHRNHIAAKNKSLHMFTEIDENLPDAEIDSQRIDEVMDNLLSNAIKFTPTGGTVRIKTYRDNSAVVVEINDNGLGLTEEDLKHAFQRGARLSAKPTQGESSTGLGLWIVKKLLDAHHGKIWVKSTIGKGSTFSFSIPLTQPKSDEND